MISKFTIFAPAFLALLDLAALTSGAAKAADNPQTEFFQIIGRGHELAAIDFHLANIRSEKDQLTSAASQSYHQTLTFSARYREAIEGGSQFDMTRKRLRSEPVLSAVAGLDMIPAIDAIRMAAKSHRILLINEAHNNGAHRAFARRLVRTLWADGFRFLGMETLWLDDSWDTIQAESVPRKLGHYTNDPASAGIIRAARTLGYHMIQYEDHTPNNAPPVACDGSAPDWVRNFVPKNDNDLRITKREKTQACNLAQAVRAMPQGEKLVVLVGYGHLSKLRDPANAKEQIPRMATYLQAYLGEEVLSVDQTSGDIYDPLPGSKFAAVKTETVFADQAGKFYSPSDLYDMVVYRPDPRFRENWHRPDDELREVMVSPMRGAWTKGLVMAANLGEGFDYVPVDQSYVDAIQQPNVRLLLPAGTYAIRQEVHGGGITELGLIHVADRDGTQRLRVREKSL